MENCLTEISAVWAYNPKLLRIGRRHHRSNGTSFDVRATLNTAPLAGRVTPDTYARLTTCGTVGAVRG